MTMANGKKGLARLYQNTRKLRQLRKRKLKGEEEREGGVPL